MDAAARAIELIDITDLRDPTLTPVQSIAMRATARRPVTLSRDAVLEAARAATGLADFGALDFLPRLDCWMQAVEEDANVSSFGRTNVFQLAVRCAVNRLRLEDFLRRHPEAEEGGAGAAGYHCRHAAHRHHLHAGVDRRRSALSQPALVGGADPNTGPERRPDRAGREPASHPRRRQLARHGNAAARQRLMHEFSADHIAEDIDLHVLNFSSYFLEWDAYVSRWRDWYLAEDQRGSYRYARRAMQALTYLRGPARWVLKCPQHMEQLAALADVFPEATYVLCHRDPVASIRSAMAMALYTARMLRARVDAAEPLAYWPDRFERMLRACVRDRDKLPAARTLDVYFHDWIGNPDQVLRQIYDRAGLPIDAARLAAMHASSAEHHRKSSERLVYNLERDFGVTAAALRAPFGFYFDRFAVREEV